MDLTTTVPGRILLVGPSDAGGLERALAVGPWLCDRSDTPAGVLRRLRTESDIDLVFLVPGASMAPCIDLCRQIKFDARTVFVVECRDVVRRVTDCIEVDGQDCR